MPDEQKVERTDKVTRTVDPAGGRVTTEQTTEQSTSQGSSESDDKDSERTER